MCGRFYIDESDEIKQLVDIINRRKAAVPGLKQSGEIFPGDVVPVLAASRDHRLTAFAMQWGYHLDKKLLFNARCETASEKAIFQDGFARHRCIIPAAGYYEWDAQHIKYAIHPEQQWTFLAGICRMEDGPVFTILTR